MLLYNITTKVDHAISDQWLQWQKEIHIPEIMATGLFYEHRMYRLLGHDDPEGKTYITQFFTSSEKNYEEYLLHFAPGLREKALVKWGDQIVAFRTLLENVE
ncbi:MAG TPA: DUF4286 family protein [Hanamia sp.]|jgi:hypothetical protein|nr:DUF4286 family protein [Hanamia sp.]